MRPVSLAAAALLLSTGCSVVKMHRVRPDYAQADQTQTKRLVVVTQPLPDGQQKAGELFSLVARRYVNQKRDFIVKDHRAQAEPVDVKGVCGEGLEGVLWLKPAVQKKGDGVEGEVDAQLLRCRDGEEVWAAKVGGSFESADGRLKEVTSQYVAELGGEVQPYVAPAFHLLRPMLDTLPQPKLNEQDVDEKIELGE